MTFNKVLVKQCLRPNGSWYHTVGPASTILPVCGPDRNPVGLFRHREPRIAGPLCVVEQTERDRGKQCP